MKLLTYIVPLYNSAKWLNKCLDSVLNQDFDEELVEIICINDGSPDNSAEIARSYQSEHPSIIVIDQDNQGTSGARNTGMRHATGKYLAFVDPDDFVEPNVYGSLVKQMEEEQLDMLRFNFQMVDEDYAILEKPLSEKIFDYTPSLMSGPEFIASRLDGACNIWRYIYRTDIITKNNIWCYQGDYYDDTPWLPLVLMKAQRINICDTIVYDYLERSNSLVKSVTEESIKRKIDGYLFLLPTLKKQHNSLNKYLPNVGENTQRGVSNWYSKMEALSIISFFSIIALYRFKERHHYIRIVREFGLLPLKGTKLVPKALKKKRVINISPTLYMWMISIKNRH